MGDILHALPAVTALRQAHPEISLGWVVEPQWRPLLCADSSTPGSVGSPLVDAVYTAHAKQWARRPLAPSTLASIRKLRSELRHGSYDIAVDLQGAIRSAVIARWSRAKRLLGEAEPRESAARWLYGERIRTRGAHVIEQSASVVRALFRESLPIGLPMLPHDPVAAAWCDRSGLAANGGPVVLLSPGAGWGAKRWPVDRYAHAGAALSRQAGAQIIINAAPGELDLGAALATELRALGVQPLMLTPTLAQLIELTRRVTLAIGGDTGPLHLAAALGKLTLGIYGPTDPARNGPYHGNFLVLRDPESRRDHTRRSSPEAGLLRIQPDAVVEAALSLLQLPSTDGRRVK